MRKECGNESVGSPLGITDHEIPAVLQSWFKFIRTSRGILKLTVDATTQGSFDEVSVEQKNDLAEVHR